MAILMVYAFKDADQLKRYPRLSKLAVMLIPSATRVTRGYTSWPNMFLPLNACSPSKGFTMLTFTCTKKILKEKR